MTPAVTGVSNHRNLTFDRKFTYLGRGQVRPEPGFAAQRSPVLLSPDPITTDEAKPPMSRHCAREGCKAWAIKGGTICNRHGGNARQVRSKAAVRHELSRWTLG